MWLSRLYLKNYDYYLTVLLCFVSSSSVIAVSNEILNQRSSAVLLRLPILYVYSFVEAICSTGLPDYLKVALEQAIYTQFDSEIFFASNFAECEVVYNASRIINHLNLVDTTYIESNRTKLFRNSLQHMVVRDKGGELWMTSALRFFLIEDVMRFMGFNEVMHVEGDNLLYGELTSILPVLRTGYPRLAATPLTHPKVFITASVFWVANITALIEFNNYLLNLGNNKNGLWEEYCLWLARNGGGKSGVGVDPISIKIGIKPFAINEMSMLAYYHSSHPSELKLLPVVPKYNYGITYVNRYIFNISEYGPFGRQVGPQTGEGIWDSGSWGQVSE